jgi:hypothetical protein
MSAHDRLGPNQSSLEHQEVGVNQHPHVSDQSRGPVRPVAEGGHNQFLEAKCVLRRARKKLDNLHKKAMDIKENTASGVIKIGNNDVVMRDCFKGHVVINGPVQ